MDEKMLVKLDRKILAFFLSLIVTVILTACGSSGGGDSSGRSSSDNTDSVDPANNPSELDESLIRLGVDVEQSPRLDDFGNPISESYSPMGYRFVASEIQNADGSTSFAMGSRNELFIMGKRLQNCLEDECFVSLIDDAAGAVDLTNNPDIIYRRIEPAPWAVESLERDDPPETLRAGTGADVDGDGRSEIVVVYYDQPGAELRLSVADTDAPGAMLIDIAIPLSSEHFPVADVRIAAGNFDLDVKDELAVGISRGATAPGSTAFVLIIDDQANNFALIQEVEIPAMDGNRSISLVLKSGQIDFDGPDEILLVQNEIGGTINIPGPGGANISAMDAAARYHILDSDDSSFALVRTGSIQSDFGQGSELALIGDVALGDIDADNLDEIVFAGLTEVPANGTCEPVGHVLIVLDDSIHGMEKLSDSFSKVDDGRCPDFDPWRLRFVDVNLIDLDGDEDLEIQVNQFTFDELPEGMVSWDVESKFNASSMTGLLFRDSEGRALFDRSRRSITVGDITGDGRENLITYLQGDDVINIFGINPEDPGTSNGAKPSLQRLKTIKVVPGGAADRTNLVLVSTDTDKDGSVYTYTGEHEFVFTEPIVMAALAAAPCQVGIDQNLDDCTTTWGQSTTLGTGREKGYELSVGGSIGRKGDLQSCGGVGVSVCTTVFEYEIKAKLELALSRARSQSYELTKSIAFTTGPIEDSVVFTSVPLDLYTYIVQSHPDPLRIGEEVGITLPREPITRIAERNFYNANVKEGSMKIDDDIFSHIRGEVFTYPSIAQKEAILDSRRSKLEDVRAERFIVANPLYDDEAPLDALRGLEVGPVGVGQGRGSTEIGLDLAKEESLTVTHEIRFSLEVEVTGAHILGGFNFGATGSHAMTVSKGEITTYSGNIGSIDGDNFLDNLYEVGLFTYLQADPANGLEFEVINYWVN